MLFLSQPFQLTQISDQQQSILAVYAMPLIWWLRNINTAQHCQLVFNGMSSITRLYSAMQKLQFVKFYFGRLGVEIMLFGVMVKM